MLQRSRNDQNLRRFKDLSQQNRLGGSFEGCVSLGGDGECSHFIFKGNSLSNQGGGVSERPIIRRKSRLPTLGRFRDSQLR